MIEITIRSSYGDGIKEIVEGALANEARNLDSGIRRTEQRLELFERKFGVSTVDFLQRLLDGSIEETLDTIEWLGEAKLLERLKQKRAILRDLEIATP